MKIINNIFIVDDDTITLFGLKRILSKITTTSNIFEFKNGQLAIDNITSRLNEDGVLPEVIFLDLNMPILDGWSFLEEFINLNIEKPVHINIITSSIDPNDKNKWLHYKSKTHHSIDYLNKPLYKIDRKHLFNMNMAS